MTIATEEDIYACFRLLLGRQPNPEEIPGHMGLAGTSLDAAVSSYLNSLEFRNRGLFQSSDDVELVTLERFSVFVAKDDHLIAPGIRFGYEPEVTASFLAHLRPGGWVLDVGANCGYFTMLAASLGANVMAFEPLQRNLRLLHAGLRQNQFDHVRVIGAAASDHAGTLPIGAAFTNGIVGKAPSTAEAALAANYVASVTIDSIVEAEDVSLIKIDVEGHEHRSLLGAVRTIGKRRPVIISEFAPPALEANSGVSGSQYLRLLSGFGYNISIIGRPYINTLEGILEAAAGIDHVDILAVPVAESS